MSRYPKSVRAASVKCIACNAPVVQTVDGAYGCVKCGDSPVEKKQTQKKEPAVAKPSPLADD